eukprot:scaffold7442_cov101-Isochrysis_galbana.AAC.1
MRHHTPRPARLWRGGRPSPAPQSRARRRPGRERHPYPRARPPRRRQPRFPRRGRRRRGCPPPTHLAHVPAPSRARWAPPPQPNLLPEPIVLLARAAASARQDRPPPSRRQSDEPCGRSAARRAPAQTRAPPPTEPATPTRAVSCPEAAPARKPRTAAWCAGQSSGGTPPRSRRASRAPPTPAQRGGSRRRPPAVTNPRRQFAVTNTTCAAPTSPVARSVARRNITSSPTYSPAGRLAASTSSNPKQKVALPRPPRPDGALVVLRSPTASEGSRACATSTASSATCASTPPPGAASGPSGALMSRKHPRRPISPSDAARDNAAKHDVLHRLEADCAGGEHSQPCPGLLLRPWVGHAHKTDLVAHAHRWITANQTFGPRASFVRERRFREVEEEFTGRHLGADETELVLERDDHSPLARQAAPSLDQTHARDGVLRRGGSAAGRRSRTELALDQIADRELCPALAVAPVEVEHLHTRRRLSTRPSSRWSFGGAALRHDGQPATVPFGAVAAAELALDDRANNDRARRRRQCPLGQRRHAHRCVTPRPPVRHDRVRHLVAD